MNRVVVASFFVFLGAAGCGAARLQLTPDEYGLMARGKGAMPVVKLDPAKPAAGSVLRARANPIAPDDVDLTMLLDRMRATLVQTGGVGLAAPQIGISRRVLLVLHGTRPAGQKTRVEAYINPRMEWASSEIEDDYEGCLSVDGGSGLVPRPRSVKVSYDQLGGGPRQLIELTGWDARIMQHELDHLDGVLFIDKLKGGLLPVDEARKRRNELHRSRGWLPPAASQPEKPAASQPEKKP
jgi:peptide deformylase